jgi:flagellar biosynthetic protein FlhB
MQMEMAQRRMMEAIPSADVVITNPTHFAIAIKFDAKQMAAPQVVAKGADYIALRIREIAEEHNVPRVENKPLARALFRSAEIGDFIPEELYRAVAEVLAYVYRLKGIRPSKP